MKQNSRLLHLIALCSTVLVVGGCAVTSGAVFSSVVRAEADGSESEDSGAIVSTPDSDSEPGDQTALEVITTPPGADVYIGFRRIGRSPLEVTDIDPGRYRLTIELDRHHPEERTVVVREDARLVLEIDLEPITGFLDVDITPRDAVVYADGEPLTQTLAELPIGRYTVRAEKFGYQDASREVTIRENDVSHISFELEEAAFAVEQLSLDRSVFSPQNPGILGRVALSYRVTAAGRGRFTVTSPSGRVVYERSVGEFRSWEQQETWDGTGLDGNPVSDGTYIVALSLTGTDGRQVQRQQSVTVDSTRVVRYRSVWGSSPGLAYAPAGPPLPSAQYQITAQSAGIITVVDNAIATRFPTRLGVRAGLGAGFEIAGLFGFTAGSAPLQSRITAGGTLAWQSPAVPVAPGLAASAGAIASGMYTAPYDDGGFAGPDTQGSHPGVALTLPAELALGSVRFTLAPEYRLSPAPAWYGTGSRPANEWTSLGFLRLGAVADLANWSLGASALVRSRPLAEGLALALPVNASLEAHWLVPDTPVGLTFFVAAEVMSPTDFYAMSGVGLGLLF